MAHPRIGIALGTGAARGWSHIGVLQGLEEMGVQPAVISGCSAGALVAGAYAGGNLQKLILARETGEKRPAILMVFPTLGLDIAATRAVYRRMADAAAGGAAILWISEEIDDLLALAHSISVLRAGRIAAGFRNDGTVTRDRLGEAMTGGHA